MEGRGWPGPYLAPGYGPAGDPHYQVRPEGVQHLQQEQEEIEEPPGREGAHNLPALKKCAVENPDTQRHTERRLIHRCRRGEKDMNM